LSQLETLKQIVTGRVAKDEPMAGYTTLGVGGPADYFVEVMSEDELASLMRYIYENSISWMIIGDGANLLVSDKGIRGIIIKLGEPFKLIEVNPPFIKAGSSARISKVADVAAQNDLGGLEGVGTVPGSLGGAIVMNAGTHRGYIDEVTESVSIVTDQGEKRALSNKECGFSYRNSRFQWDQSMIITFATFKMRNADGEAIAANLESVRRHRDETQPPGKSAGCFFKNPPGLSAGKLVEGVGCKGWQEGGAIVSRIHANFIMNADNATASDLYNLAERVRMQVLEVHDIELEYEIRLVGEW
jgi:UDP-N-acetylmuramate dehydrogenase